jgi:hypothetical protein
MDARKIALIHAIKDELELSDRAYRALLQDAAGVRSSTELDEEGFRRLMRAFVRSRHYRVQPGGLTVRQRMYIRRLVADLEWSDEHAANFLRKYYGCARVEELGKRDASKAIESLKNVLKHRTADREPPSDRV